ncbi:ABC transporter permease subunit [Paenibacillus peoriae]|uniref:ABC transporter permease n=1 Tax=Paenibacillus peoriae TaxID=59893 RepID=UPI00026C633D|nr:ABC transporter permease subunit [Paenibacillus peoriae]MEC0182208.1 ABC transporter permease subunit [Paenibacillus peoriae]
MQQKDINDNLLLEFHAINKKFGGKTILNDFSCKLYRGEVIGLFAYIIIPGLAVPILTGITLAVGSAVRITIMAELLGSDKGIGYSLALARVNMDTAKVFAWTAVSIILIIVIEHMILRPLRQYIMRWNAVE